MRITLWIIDVIAIILSVLWYVEVKTYEPIITGLASLGGLIALLSTGRKSNGKHKKQILKQKAGKKSKQYQSGGDMTINE